MIENKQQIQDDIVRRINEVISVKTGGNKLQFADSIGCSRQQLNHILNGVSVGLFTIISILKRYPDIDARWLILGEGTMIRHIKKIIPHAE